MKFLGCLVAAGVLLIVVVPLWLALQGREEGTTFRATEEAALSSATTQYAAAWPKYLRRIRACFLGSEVDWRSGRTSDEAVGSHWYEECDPQSIPEPDSLYPEDADGVSFVCWFEDLDTCTTCDGYRRLHPPPVCERAVNSLDLALPAAPLAVYGTTSSTQGYTTGLTRETGLRSARG
jgi:hypothetical protein